MKKVIVLSIVVTTLVLFGQADDALSPESITLLSEIEAPPESDAYLYLLGMAADETQDPMEAGSRFFDQLKHQEMGAYQQPDSIPLPQGELFCSLREKDCLEKLFSQNLDMGALELHSILITRVERFHEFGEYRTLTTPSVDEQLPSFRYLGAAERLRALRAIAAHKEGRSEEAVAALRVQLASLRQSLALQDNLVGKMVFVALVSEVIEILHSISVDSGIDAGVIVPLSAGEKDLTLAAVREFAMFVRTLEELDRNPEFFQPDAYVPGWLVRLFYKPNMTINALAPTFTRMQRLSILTPAEFAKEIVQGEKPDTSTSGIRNPLGRALLSVSADYDEYVAAVHDLDAKIELFNYSSEMFKEADNPYYPGETPDFLPGMTCFRGPLMDERYIRCLRTPFEGRLMGYDG